jgi:phosphate starvation-inducible protein PhoH|uniref:PhoH-like protein n=1 Tax=viral metagenome TaxID=1070528 RepID=A0A6C0EL66_9ZZZZ
MYDASNVFDLFDPTSELGMLGNRTAGRGRGRKGKKQTEKDIMKEYMMDHPAKPSPWLQQRKIYENMQYLSANEREQFEKKFTKPKNPSQKKLAAYLNDPSRKIVISTGPAGTGKTLFSTQSAIRGLLTGTYDKIIFTRPSVSVDEELGFLPGTLEEKMAPWMRPLYDILHAHITPKETAQLIEDKVIEICPLGFMRGRTFKNCCIVADEMQNCSLSQMKLILTRIGENTRLFITGDLEQCDRLGERNGLEDFLEKIRKRRSNSISSVEFEICDVERENVVKEVLEIYAAAELEARTMYQELSSTSGSEPDTEEADTESSEAVEGAK